MRFRPQLESLDARVMPASLIYHWNVDSGYTGEASNRSNWLINGVEPSEAQGAPGSDDKIVFGANKGNCNLSGTHFDAMDTTGFSGTINVATNLTLNNTYYDSTLAGGTLAFGSERSLALGGAVEWYGQDVTAGMVPLTVWVSGTTEINGLSNNVAAGVLVVEDEAVLKFVSGGYSDAELNFTTNAIIEVRDGGTLQNTDIGASIHADTGKKAHVKVIEGGNLVIDATFTLKSGALYGYGANIDINSGNLYLEGSADILGIERSAGIFNSGSVRGTTTVQGGAGMWFKEDAVFSGTDIRILGTGTAVFGGSSSTHDVLSIVDSNVYMGNGNADIDLSVSGSSSHVMAFSGTSSLNVSLDHTAGNVNTITARQITTAGTTTLHVDEYGTVGPITQVLLDCSAGPEVTFQAYSLPAGLEHDWVTGDNFRLKRNTIGGGVGGVG